MWITLTVDETERARFGGEPIKELPEQLFLGRRGGDVEHVGAPRLGSVDVPRRTRHLRQLPLDLVEPVPEARSA